MWISNGHGGRRQALFVAGAALAIVGLLALGSARGLFAPDRAGPLEKLSIALPATPHAALLYLAVTKGYFADEGLDVTVTPVSHGKAAIDLVQQGRVDLGSAAEVPLVLSILDGAPLGIAASVVSVSTEMAVIARRDRGIASPRDLQGKKVGVTYGTSGEYYLWAFLIRHKLAPQSITLVDVPPGKMVEALSSGTIDAASTWEPIKSKLHVALSNNGVSFTEPDAYTVMHVVVGRNDFLRTQSKTIEKLIRGLLKAEAFNRSEPEDALKLVADSIKLDVQTLQHGWSDISFEVGLRQSQLITLEDEARWAVARGYVAEGPMPNFLSHLHPAALLVVSPDRVTVVR